MSKHAAPEGVPQTSGDYARDRQLTAAQRAVLAGCIRRSIVSPPKLAILDAGDQIEGVIGLTLSAETSYVPLPDMLVTCRHAERTAFMYVTVREDTINSSVLCYARTAFRVGPNIDRRTTSYSFRDAESGRLLSIAEVFERADIDARSVPESKAPAAPTTLTQADFTEVVTVLDILAPEHITEDPQAFFSPPYLP